MSAGAFLYLLPGSRAPAAAALSESPHLRSRESSSECPPRSVQSASMSGIKKQKTVGCGPPAPTPAAASRHRVPLPGSGRAAGRGGSGAGRGGGGGRAGRGDPGAALVGQPLSSGAPGNLRRSGSPRPEGAPERALRSRPSRGVRDGKFPVFPREPPRTRLFLRVISAPLEWVAESRGRFCRVWALGARRRYSLGFCPCHPLRGDVNDRPRGGNSSCPRRQPLALQLVQQLPAGSGRHLWVRPGLLGFVG